MYKFKKIIVIILGTIVLYYALVSESFFPNVTIAVRDALIICTFVVLTCLIIKLIALIDAKQLRRKILLQYSQMSAIMNSAPYAIYLKKPDGTIILTNKYHADLLNSTPEKLIGKSSYELFVDTEQFQNEDKEIFEKKACMLSVGKLNTIHGNSSWYRLSKTPILNSEGNVESILVILQNIDEEKDIEERKNTFVATLTHDLKTPTIAQIKALDLLLNDSFGCLSLEQKDIVTEIKNSCNYMYNLIFTILDSYLYDNGRVKITKDYFDINDLINSTVNEISKLLEEKKQKIVISLELTSYVAYADYLQIKRVLTNLVANAINYSIPDSIINISVSENESEIIIDVKNKSKKISDEYLKHIYDKYKPVTMQKSKNAGSGLGLYLSKQIIDSHNGSLYAMSDEDGNCTFGFTIPKNLEQVD